MWDKKKREKKLKRKEKTLNEENKRTVARNCRNSGRFELDSMDAINLSNFAVVNGREELSTISLH